jgi:membrane-bound serine protease (ClpP class)
MGLVGALMLLAIVSFAVRARRRPVVSGVEGLLRERAQAVESFEREGLVRAHGEIWRAVSHEPVQEGQRLRIVAVKGLRLEVEPVRD